MSLKSKEQKIDANSITMLILNRQWQLLNVILAKYIHSCDHYYKSKCGIDCSQRHSILHFALQYNAPLYIIRQIVKNGPTLVNENDCMGHFPLQTALIHGTTRSVVEYLIETNKKSSTLLDRDGKTSLHLAFDAYDNVEERVTPATIQILESLPQIIRLVCSLNPSQILKEDVNGMNVLEYAIEKEADYSIIRRLQKIIMGIRRKAQRRNNEYESKQKTETNVPQKSMMNFFKKMGSGVNRKANIIAGRSA